MKNKTTVFNSLNFVDKISDIVDVIPKKALEQPYREYKKYKHGKGRVIEEPNAEIKTAQKKLLKLLQDNLTLPSYCMAGGKGQNNIKNADKHVNKREVLTMDISHYFPNTQEKYVRKFFTELCGKNNELIEILLKLTTYKNHLPTGAPTSPLLSCFVHKEIFDSIYKKMLSINVDMTVYIDDITLSSNKHIGDWVIGYIQNSLKQHGLYLNKSKCKRFSYKHAIVTGVHIAQCGKKSAPFAIGYSVIQNLKSKNIKDMSIKELESLIANISYLQQFKPQTLSATKNKLRKQLKKIRKIQINK